MKNNDDIPATDTTEIEQLINRFKQGELDQGDALLIEKLLNCNASAGWEECKMEEELDRLAVKSANRYCRDETGRWRCPPGETYAAQFGLYYQVVSSAGINWIWQRNIIFLDDYLRTATGSIAVRRPCSQKDRRHSARTISVPAQMKERHTRRRQCSRGSPQRPARNSSRKETTEYRQRRPCERWQ
jgi:hypothetical protein